MEKSTMEKLMEYALQWLKTAEEFTMEQAPLIVQEFYMWETAASIFWIVLGLLFLIVAYRFHRYGMGKEDEDARYNRYSEYEGLLAIPVVVLGVIGFFMFLANVFDLIYISVAPRMYLIETVTGWLSGGN